MTTQHITQEQAVALAKPFGVDQTGLFGDGDIQSLCNAAAEFALQQYRASLAQGIELPAPDRLTESIDRDVFGSACGITKHWSYSPELVRQAIAADRAKRESGEPRLLENYEAIIDEYVEDYEMNGETAEGVDCTYTTTEDDRALLKDAFMGFDFMSLYTHPTEPAQLKPDITRAMVAEMDMNDRVLAAIDAESTESAQQVDCDCGRTHKLTAYGWSSNEPAQQVSDAPKPSGGQTS